MHAGVRSDFGFGGPKRDEPASIVLHMNAPGGRLHDTGMKGVSLKLDDLLVVNTTNLRPCTTSWANEAAGQDAH